MPFDDTNPQLGTARNLVGIVCNLANPVRFLVEQCELVRLIIFEQGKTA